MLAGDDPALHRPHAAGEVERRGERLRGELAPAAGAGGTASRRGRPRARRPARRSARRSAGAARRGRRSARRSGGSAPRRSTRECPARAPPCRDRRGRRSAGSLRRRRPARAHAARARRRSDRAVRRSGRSGPSSRRRSRRPTSDAISRISSGSGRRACSGSRSLTKSAFSEMRVASRISGTPYTLRELAHGTEVRQRERLAARHVQARLDAHERDALRRRRRARARA